MDNDDRTEQPVTSSAYGKHQGSSERIEENLRNLKRERIYEGNRMITCKESNLDRRKWRSAATGGMYLIPGNLQRRWAPYEKAHEPNQGQLP